MIRLIPSRPNETPHNTNCVAAIAAALPPLPPPPQALAGAPRTASSIRGASSRMPVDTVLLLSMLVIAAVPNRLHSVVDGRGEEARASKEANRERVRVIRTRPFLPSPSPPSLPAADGLCPCSIPAIKGIRSKRVNSIPITPPAMIPAREVPNAVIAAPMPSSPLPPPPSPCIPFNRPLKGVPPVQTAIRMAREARTLRLLLLSPSPLPLRAAVCA